MIDSMQYALLRKDLRGITTNKRMFSILLTVPIMMAVILPIIFILATELTPNSNKNFGGMTALLSASGSEGDIRKAMTSFMFNYVMPVLFTFIPVMASSVMAASSFIGEKEKRTLETLLYSPLSLRRIFQAKVLASLALGMLVTLISFVAMVVSVEAAVLITTGGMAAPGISWLVTLLIVSPSVSLLAITLIVGGSAKSKSMEESQQRAVFLIMPLLLLIVGQFAGIFMVSAWLLLVLGLAFAAIAFVLLKSSMSRFTYEELLK